jgi:acetoin utilization protein AcuB
MANSHALNTLKKKAHQIMTRDVVTISPDENAEDAATIMLENKFSCLPVVDELDAICGIVTKTDLLQCLCGAKSTSKT